MPRANRRTFVTALTATAALSAVPWRVARAQDYPAGPVKLIVPYPPGAATDALARLMGQALEHAIGGTFVIDNRGGGATLIGTRAVATAAPDGQTLGFVDTSFVINPGLFGAQVPFDTRKDFAPLSLMATAPLVLLVHKSVPANTLKEFLALAKAKPGTLNYGSAGLGSAPHLAGEQLRQAAQVDITHVPYRGGSTVITDLLGGQVQFGFTTVPTMIEHIRSGAVRALAVCGATRAALLPQVPTMAESGLPAVDATPLFGLLAPAKTPPAVLAKLSAAASSAVREGPLHKRLLELGFVPVGSSADEFKARIDAEITKWTEVVRKGNIKPTA